MPIELRPSDVAFARANAYNQKAKAAGQRGSQWAGVLAQILSVAFERERVSEVNSGLATQMEFWPKEQQDFTQTPFEITPETPEGMRGLPPAIMAPIKKPLGQVTHEDVLERHNKAVQAMADNINRTVRNKRAREELLQHLAVGSAQQSVRLLNDWKVASQDHALAGLANLTKATMAQVKDLGWEEVARRIGLQTTQMMQAGQMKETEAQEYLGAVQKQAQYAWSYAKTLEAMEAGGVDDGIEAGTAWIENNTPFWDADPGMREKVFQDAKGKYTKYLEELAKAQDTQFSDKFVSAGTVGELDALKKELESNTLMRGTQKHTWSEWIREKRDRIKKAGAEGAEDVVSSLYSRMYEAADRNKNPGLEVTIREIDETVKDPEKHQALLSKRNELQKSHENGLGSTREDVLLAGYDIAFHPNMSVAAKQKWIDDHAKPGAGLSAEDAKKLRGWIDPYNEDPARKEAMDAINDTYKISMANPNLGTAAKKALALELYNARNEMIKLFEKPGITKPEIDRAVESFLNKKAVKDLEGIVKQTTGEDIGFATGEIRGKYREATVQEYLREQGQLTGEAAAQFPQKVRAKAEALEKDTLNKAGLKAEFTTRLTSGDMIYSTKPIAKGATGKLLMSGTGTQGVLYQVRYQVKNGTYVPTVYTQNPETGAFDVIAWEWK